MIGIALFILGLIIGIILYLMDEFRAEYLVTDYNIFEAKSLKDVELFNQSLFNLMNQKSTLKISWKM